MRTAGIYILSVVLLFAPCCTPQKGLNGNDVMFSIETTQCMGNCPVYRAEIYKNGFIVYEGKMYVEKIGMYTGKLSSRKINELENLFMESEFFSLKDEYIEPWTDLPTTYIYYSDGTKHKRIKDYYGAPEELKTLEKKVKQIIDSANLKPKPGKFLLNR